MPPARKVPGGDSRPVGVARDARPVRSSRAIGQRQYRGGEAPRLAGVVQEVIHDK